MIPIAKPMMGAEEAAAVTRILATGQMAQGEQVALFEKNFAAALNVKEAVAVSNGTSALHLSLLAHGIGQGDEVITTPFSFAATGNTILLVGATPVFVDIKLETYTLDPDAVEAAITPRTKAIMPVHLYGYCSDMDRLMAIAEKHNLVMIEDACQAHMASIRGKMAGTWGTGAFSFYSTKNMTTGGEGGMITTNDSAIADRVRLLRSHGQKVRYYHVDIGYNMRITEIQGAIGVIQLEKLPRFNQQRIANAAYLTEHLQGLLPVPVVEPGYTHVYHQYTVRVPGDRDAFSKALAERGVGSAVHYPMPIHKQPAYIDRGFGNVTLPNAELAARSVLSLPVHPALTREDLETVAREVAALCH